MDDGLCSLLRSCAACALPVSLLCKGGHPSWLAAALHRAGEWRGLCGGAVGRWRCRVFFVCLRGLFWGVTGVTVACAGAAPTCAGAAPTFAGAAPTCAGAAPACAGAARRGAGGSVLVCCPRGRGSGGFRFIFSSGARVSGVHVHG